jgi:hypothetical protein
MRSSALIDCPRGHVRSPPGDVLFTAVRTEIACGYVSSRLDVAWQHQLARRDALQPHHLSRVLARRGDRQSRR